MSSFILKIVAIISMLLDHSSYAILGRFSFLNYIGRIAFPIFAFGISEGYSHTRDLKKYFLRLAIFALVSQLPYYLFFSNFTNQFTLNIFFTLILGLLAITIYDKIPNQLISLPIIGLLAYFASVLPFEYSWYGVTLIFIFYLFKNYKLASNICVFATMSIYAFFEYWKKGFGYHAILLWIFMLFSLLFINFYNQKKGKDFKYILYLFYPLHLVFLYATYLLLH